MKIKPFAITNLSMTYEDVAVAAFFALQAAAWSLYNTALMAVFVKFGTDPDAVPDEEKRKFAKAAFGEVIQLLPQGNPLRGELQRYLDEAVLAD